MNEFRCEGCGGVFSSVFELRRHQYGHDKGCLRDKETRAPLAAQRRLSFQDDDVAELRPVRLVPLDVKDVDW